MTEPTTCAIHRIDLLELRPAPMCSYSGRARPGRARAAAGARRGGPGDSRGADESSWRLPRVWSRHDCPDGQGGSGSLACHPARAAPEGYDVVIEATGAIAVGELCLPLARDGGTVLIYGMADEQALLALHPYEIFRRSSR